MAIKKIRVLVVDDSALVRQILVEVLNAAPDVEVVGTASDPFMARDRIKELNPDVLTLDVEMPRMDGLTFLANLMRLRPMPVVMVSSLTEQGADTTLKALELGAIDFVSKPKIDVAGTLADFGDEILSKIRMAAGARVMARSAPVAVGARGAQIFRGRRDPRRVPAARCCVPPTASSPSAPPRVERKRSAKSSWDCRPIARPS